MDKLSDLRPEELEILKRVQKLSLYLERHSADGKFPEAELQKICFLLSNLAQAKNLSVRKLAEIPDHLHPEMSLRHFQNFLIPLDRLLGRSLRDDEFLIASDDKKVPSTKQTFPLIFILENIRSAFNVGSIFRLADGLGVKEIHLCGYTPLPDSKTALGTEVLVDHRSFSKVEDSIATAKAAGYTVWSLETAEKAESLLQVKFTGATALLVGNERFGLEAEVIRQTQGALAIPMDGIKNSLNVANALAIAGFEWKRQWLKLNLNQ